MNFETFETANVANEYDKAINRIGLQHDLLAPSVEGIASAIGQSINEQDQPLTDMNKTVKRVVNGVVRAQGKYLQPIQDECCTVIQSRITEQNVALNYCTTRCITQPKTQPVVQPDNVDPLSPVGPVGYNPPVFTLPGNPNVPNPSRPPISRPPVNNPAQPPAQPPPNQPGQYVGPVPLSRPKTVRPYSSGTYSQGTQPTPGTGGVNPIPTSGIGTVGGSGLDAPPLSGPAGGNTLLPDSIIPSVPYGGYPVQPVIPEPDYAPLPVVPQGFQDIPPYTQPAPIPPIGQPPVRPSQPIPYYVPPPPLPPNPPSGYVPPDFLPSRPVTVVPSGPVPSGTQPATNPVQEPLVECEPIPQAAMDKAQAVYIIPWGAHHGGDAYVWSDCGMKLLNEQLAKLDPVSVLLDAFSHDDWERYLFPWMFE